MSIEKYITQHLINDTPLSPLSTDSIEDDLQEHNAVASMHAAIGWNPVWIGLYQDYSDPNYREPDGGWKWVEKYSYPTRNIKCNLK